MTRKDITWLFFIGLAVFYTILGYAKDNPHIIIIANIYLVASFNWVE